jgi:hypothetical protein
MSMNTYEAPYVKGLPNWDEIPAAELSNSPWGRPPDGLTVSARLCYDKNGLKVRLCARESRILSRFEGLCDMVCLDSCLEFFFCPQEKDKRYFNFEFNPRGALYLGFGTDRHNSVRQVLTGYRELFSVAPFGVPDGWGMEFSIPLSFMRIYLPDLSLEKGHRMRGNFYKCGDETETPHYLCWNPIIWEKPDFHQSKFFGSIVLSS